MASLLNAQALQRSTIEQFFALAANSSLVGRNAQLPRILVDRTCSSDGFSTMSLIVAKFGGSSVQNAAQIEKVKKIVQANSGRRFVVVSAPGKEERYNKKITDHLFNIATSGRHFKNERHEITAQESVQAVIHKFETLERDLGIDAADLIESLRTDLARELPDNKRIAFYASRGEHYSARFITRYFRKEGMEAGCALPENIPFLVRGDYDNAKVDEEAYVHLANLKNNSGITIMPGYYGVTRDGDIAIFSRGGSDLTGGELAYALSADLYENWTDTDGIYEADPRIITRANVIPRLTYKEIRLLASKGFNVFHFDAMVNCKKRNIPINIRNTNNPSAPGTLIVNERVPQELIAGIARVDHIAYVYLEKDTLGESGAFIEELLDIFRRYEVQTYHYPVDKDDIAVLLDQNDLIGKINNVRREIEDRLKPDSMKVMYDFSILSPVGIGMRNVPGVIAEAAAALRDNKISIETIDQGPAQISFHIGIHSAYADAGLEALFERLIEKQNLKKN